MREIEVCGKLLSPQGRHIRIVLLGAVEPLGRVSSVVVVLVDHTKQSELALIKLQI